MELAARLRAGTALAPGLPQSLDVDHVFKSAPSAYPNGCHIAEVEIDPETGHVAIARYVMVNDFGTVVNPMIVEGQLHGGVVQGIGQALFERTVYDDSGQLMSGSYMDYALPRAADVPFFSFVSQGVPTLTNRVGAKRLRRGGLRRLAALGDERASSIALKRPMASRIEGSTCRWRRPTGDLAQADSDANKSCYSMLVPNSSLEGVVAERARAIALHDLGRVAHTMKLEAQGTGDADMERRIETYIRDTLKDRDLWARS
jgi:hypothetical protein